MTDTIVAALLPTAIIAVTEVVKRVKAKEYESAATIVIAAVVGAVAGFIGISGLSLETGILAGLEAAGIVKTAQVAGVIRAN